MKLFGREKVHTLKIFEGIDPQVVEEILSNAEKAHFRAGEVIMQQDDHPNATGYIIEEWSVNVLVNNKHTAKLTAWDIFGEIALLNEEPRSASVIAESDVVTILLSQEVLFQMIENDDNSINKEIMRRMEENLESE